MPVFSGRWERVKKFGCVLNIKVQVQIPSVILISDLPACLLKALSQVRQRLQGKHWLVLLLWVVKPLASVCSGVCRCLLFVVCVTFCLEVCNSTQDCR